MIAVNRSGYTPSGSLRGWSTTWCVPEYILLDDLAIFQIRKEHQLHQQHLGGLVAHIAKRVQKVRPKSRGTLFGYVDLESRILEKHSQRKIRAIVNEALAVLDGNFGELHSEIGRPSIPPERLLRTILLQIFYALRSERLLVQRLDFDLSFRWFVGLGIDDRVWDAPSFSKNRDHLLDGDVAVRFLAATLDRPKVKRLVSTEHFSVDGTLIEAWASMKSFRRRTDDSSGGHPADGGFLRQTARRSQWQVDFHGEKRSNATHASTTDSDAMLCRKSPGAGARLCYMHVLMENRNGLVADVEATRASRHAERMAAVRGSRASPRRRARGARRSGPIPATRSASGSKTHRGGLRLGQGCGRAEED
jgi:transposase